MLETKTTHNSNQKEGEEKQAIREHPKLYH
jgi:hypothetical protein